MSSHFERVEWFWIWIIVGFIASVTIFFAYRVVVEWIENGFNPQMLAVLILSIALWALGWWVLRSAATGFTEVEIVQKTLVGTKKLAWEKVIKIENNSRGGLRIHTKLGKIMIFGLVYSNYEELVRKLREKAKSLSIQWKEAGKFE